MHIKLTFKNSLIIHEQNTKEIIAVKENTAEKCLRIRKYLEILWGISIPFSGAKSFLLIAEDKWNKQNNIRTSSLAINK